MSNMNPDVDWFFTKATKWQHEYEELRTLLLSCGLVEELKWGCPCYRIEKQNIVLIHGFKDYCALLFMKGALLQDTDGILVQQTKQVQSARQIRFRNLEEIEQLKLLVQAYVQEAIQVEKAGLTVELKKTTAYPIPDEFDRVLEAMGEVKSAFYKLTPGRQRGYLLYFSSPKQAKTREARIEKYVPTILAGKGLTD